MDKVHKAIRWQDGNGWVELRFFDPDHFGTGPHVTGHWKVFGGSGRYHNTACIVDREGQIDEGQIKDLCYHALRGKDGSELREMILETIDKEYDTSVFKKEKITQ